MTRADAARRLAALALATLGATRPADSQSLGLGALDVGVASAAGAPVENAVVFVQGPRRQVTINVSSMGAQRLTNLEPGLYVLSAKVGDLCTITPTSTYVTPGEIAKAKVVLEPCPGVADCPPLPGATVSVGSIASGHVFAVGGQGGALQICRPFMAPHRLLASPNGATVRTLALSADSRLLASGADDATWAVWDLAVGGGRSTGNTSSRALLIHFSDDGRYLAAALESGTVEVWDVNLAVIVGKGDVNGRVTAMQFTPDASFVVATIDGSAGGQGPSQQFVPARGGRK